MVNPKIRDSAERVALASTTIVKLTCEYLPKRQRKVVPPTNTGDRYGAGVVRLAGGVEPCKCDDAQAKAWRNRLL